MELVMVLLAGALAVVALGVVREHRQRRRDQERQASAGPLQAVPSRAIGYAIGADGSELGRHAAAIEAGCASHSWSLVQLVKDDSATKAGTSLRPGLAYALDQLGSGAADRLVAAQLEDLAPRMTDLRPLFEWAHRHRVTIAALDVGLDTSTPEGRLAARVLLSVSAGERRRLAERTRAGIAAAREKGHAGRPSISDRPELVEAIRAMRAGGMTLQAIANRLNDDGVPTVRGGAKWRPSSVQSALGYRRRASRSLLRSVDA